MYVQFTAVVFYFGMQTLRRRWLTSSLVVLVIYAKKLLCEKLSLELSIINTLFIDRRHENYAAVDIICIAHNI